MGKLKSLMQVKIYIHYWLLFFKNDYFRYTTTSQRRSFNSVSQFWVFFSLFSFLLSLFKPSCIKKRHIYNLHRISYTLSFCYEICYLVSQIWIVWGFWEDFFYCYSQQVLSTVANESLDLYNLIKRAPESQRL